MSPAYRNHRLETPPNSSLLPTGDTTAPGTEFLLPGREDPSPKSGVRTGIVLMALLAIFSLFSVSLYSPGLSGGTILAAACAVPALALLAVLLLPRSL